MTKYSSLAAHALHAQLCEDSDPMTLEKIERAFAALHRQQLESMIDTINESLALDPKAIQELMECNVDCNQGICDHPTILVGEKYEGFGFLLRPLGLINGMIEPITGQRIAMVYDDITDPPTLTRFEVHNPEPTRAADPAQLNLL